MGYAKQLIAEVSKVQKAPLGKGFRGVHTLGLSHLDSGGTSVNFDDPIWTYGDLPTAELLRSVAVLKATQYSSLVKYGPMLLDAAQRFPLAREVANLAAKKTFFKQFCGGETLAECRNLTARLQGRGVACIYDYSAEAHPGTEETADDSRFDACTSIIEHTVEFAAENGSKGFSCVKVSGLARFSLLEKVSDALYDGNLSNNLLAGLKQLEIGKVPGITGEETEEFLNSLARLDLLCGKAAALGIPMLIDAEQYSIQGAIDLCAMHMQHKYNRSTPLVYTTIQAYLKNAGERLDLLRFYANDDQDGFKYAVKQVRGAYMVSERARARELGYDSPICDSAEDTHRQFDGLAGVLLSDVGAQKCGVMFATHNQSSLMNIAHQCTTKEISRASSHLHVAQLFGMGDSLTMGMVGAGFNAAKYVPFGPVSEVMPYLTRRLQENNDALSGAPRDITLFMKVLSERDLIPWI